MDKTNTKTEYKKDVLRLATFVGELMLENGAETFRVNDTVKIICKSRGFSHINVFVAPNTIIVSDDRFDGFTFMKVIESRCIDLNKIDLLNDFSRKFVAQRSLSVDEAIKELKDLDMKSPHSKIKRNLWTAVGSSCFAVLVGGNNVITFLLTMVISVLAMIIYDKVKEFTSVPVFASITASLLIGACGIGFVRLGILDTPKMLIVGSIMPLLPGVPFIKAIRDLVSGELMSGVGRLIEAGMIATSIAVGVGMAMNMFAKIGGVL